MNRITSLSLGERPMATGLRPLAGETGYGEERWLVLNLGCLPADALSLGCCKIVRPDRVVIVGSTLPTGVASLDVKRGWEVYDGVSGVHTMTEL